MKTASILALVFCHIVSFIFLSEMRMTEMVDEMGWKWAER